MKKFVKNGVILSLVAIFFGFTLCASIVAVKYIKYKNLPINVSALSDPTLSIEVYSKDNTKIEDQNQFNGSNIKIEEIPDYTKKAFISIEDKEFYKHKGINKKRIIKATLNNMKSRSFKEGASTITQQLIKNTHLTSEKTIDRKLKEIALAQKLEKTFDKDKILESYLNIIFFGNNCYGLEQASQYYFSKSAKDLNLQESCTLAGMIKSPNRYSPITNYDLCLQRRNLVLREMEKDGYISTSEKITAQGTTIDLAISKNIGRSKINSYSQASIDEATKILGIPAKQIALSGYKIHTYFDEEKQKTLENALSDEKMENVDNMGIVIDNASCGILAYYANSNFKLFDVKRQPASALKPILVYCPALNENVISPSTQILDEKLKIGSYEPENVNKKFSGYISVADAVKNSVNIPAIKTLSYIGIDTAKSYAEKMDIEFDEKDDSYALALGGMTNGVSLANLTNAYTTFANGGIYKKAGFVQFITDKNDKLVYMHRPQEKMVFRQDSCYLMTSILQESSKSGTAKKLSDVSNTQIASKTGTAGNEKGNTDAYNIAYTPQETIGVWFGTPDNRREKIAGGNQPTNVVKKYITSQNYEKTEFIVPSSVVKIKIDSLEKEEDHRILLASSFTPNRYTEEALFSRFNMPTETSQKFLEKPKILAECKAENGQIVLSISPEKHIVYQIYKNNIPYQTISDKNAPVVLRLPFAEKEAEIKIVAKFLGNEYSNIETEQKFSMLQDKNSKTKNKKWYI